MTVLVVATNRKKHGAWAILQNYLHDEGKGYERRPIIFIFRLNIVLNDSYQADEIAMGIEDWKQKVPGDPVKSFSRVLLSMLEVSAVR